MIKHQLLLLLVFTLGLASCTKQNEQIEDLNSQWTLVGYANVLGQLNCQYKEGEVVWSFEDKEIKMNGQLYSHPLIYTSCYTVDTGYTQELEYIIEEDKLFIEDLDFSAKLNIGEELEIEIIKCSNFNPCYEGVKMYFKKI